MSGHSYDIEHVEGGQNTLWAQLSTFRATLVFMSYVEAVYWFSLMFPFWIDDIFHKLSGGLLIDPPGSVAIFLMAMLSVLLAGICAGNLGKGKLALGVTLVLDTCWVACAGIAGYVGSDLHFSSQIGVLAISVVIMLLISGF